MKQVPISISRAGRSAMVARKVPQPVAAQALFQSFRFITFSVDFSSALLYQTKPFPLKKSGDEK